MKRWEPNDFEVKYRVLGCWHIIKPGAVWPQSINSLISLDDVLLHLAEKTLEYHQEAEAVIVKHYWQELLNPGMIEFRREHSIYAERESIRLRKSFVNS